MKKIAKLLFLVFMVSSVVLVSCKKDDDDSGPTPPATPSFEILKAYLISNNLDLDDVLADWIIAASGVNAKGSDSYYIMDIRSVADFDAGHIADAVNVALKDVVTQAANATKPILLVCYTGQTAGQAVMALRLSGFADAKVLEWGMAGWNSNFSAKWVSNIDSTAQGNPSWIPAPGAVTASQTFSDPTFVSTLTDGALILEERVQTMLESGTWEITNADVLATPTAYFVNNYWALTDLEHYGNISGAYRIKPLSLEGGEYLNLDPSKDIVTYCWTGQTSSMVTAYLQILGYDAKSLLFGSNGMIYDILESHKYTVPTTDYPVVP